MNLRGSAAVAVVLFAAAVGLAACGSNSDDAESAPPKDNLSFQVRQVLATTPAAKGDCAASPAPASPAPDVALEAACSADGKTVYSLGPTTITEDNADAIGSVQRSGGLRLYVQLDEPGTTALKTMTTGMSELPSPKNQIAIVADGVVIDAPEIEYSVTDALVVRFEDESQIDPFMLRLTSASS